VENRLVTAADPLSILDPAQRQAGYRQYGEPTKTFAQTPPWHFTFNAPRRSYYGIGSHGRSWSKG
jgi:hypothetical protein